MVREPKIDIESLERRLSWTVDISNALFDHVAFIGRSGTKIGNLSIRIRLATDADYRPLYQEIINGIIRELDPK